VRLLKPHPRARVWEEEERHRYLPARSVRPIYRLLIPPIASLSAHGSRRNRTAPAPPRPAHAPTDLDARIGCRGARLGDNQHCPTAPGPAEQTDGWM
jgi:hypothetical protein